MAAKLLTAKQVSDELGIGESTVWLWARTKPGFPRAVKLSTRITRWKADEIDAWLASKLRAAA